MDPLTKQATISARLSRAHEDLVSASDSLAHGHSRTAVNRAYYAVFHAASAALCWLDIERARHSGVESAFGLYFAKAGLVEREYGRIYARTRAQREEQDYSMTTPAMTQSTVAQTIADAERFVARVEQYLRGEGAL